VRQELRPGKQRTPEQIAVMVEYLNFFLEACPAEEDGFRDDVQRALKEVWAPDNETQVRQAP
jgi:hypothetical protein